MTDVLEHGSSHKDKVKVKTRSRRPLWVD